MSKFNTNIFHQHAPMELENSYFAFFPNIFSPNNYILSL